MGLQEFKIHFDNPYATYYPEQTVTGNVILTLDSTKKVRGIKLTIKGQADTYWSTDRQELNNEGRYINETDTVTAHEEYFKAEFYLIGSNSGEEIELTAGTHTHPFNFVLPPNLPSSFESDFGRIRYTTKATLDRPWKFDQDTKAAFTVISIFDLNKQEHAYDSVQLHKSKTFCCLFCASAPLEMSVSLPVKGYVPGQVIPIKVKVENFSGIEVEKVTLYLQKIITYTATTPRPETKVVESVVAEVSKGPIGGNDNVEYEQTLDVPPLPPSSLENCGIIDLQYQFKVEASVVGRFYRNLRASSPIYIGTIPLTRYERPQPVPNSMPAPSAPEEPLPQSFARALYEESTDTSRSLRDRDDSEHVIGASERFAPRYPVYNFKPLE